MSQLGMTGLVMAAGVRLRRRRGSRCRGRWWWLGIGSVRFAGSGRGVRRLRLVRWVRWFAVVVRRVMVVGLLGAGMEEGSRLAMTGLVMGAVVRMGWGV